MKITLTRNEIERAILIHIFAKTGMRIQQNDERLWFTFAKCDETGLCQSFDVQQVDININDKEG